MKKEYREWYSPSLNHSMALNVYGHAGVPLLVFPAAGGSFYEFEDFGMIKACENFIHSGQLRVYTVGSADNESWLNQAIHPAQRAHRHNAYEAYIIREVVPFIKNDSGQHGILTTGCSFGAYHAMNFYLRHPDVFKGCIALSGFYQLSPFTDGFTNDDIYYHSPIWYLPNLNDPWFLEHYKRGKIIACCGQGAWEELMVQDTRALDDIFKAKGIHAWCDFWGHDVNHDWPWWRKQLPYFLSNIL